MLLRIALAGILAASASATPVDDCGSEQKLTRPNGEDTDMFGRSVAIGEQGILVGASGANEHGTVEFFQPVGGEWVHAQSIEPGDTNESDVYGDMIALSGDVLAVGSEFNEGTGAVYIYRYDGNLWQFEQKITGAHCFGRSIAADGDRILVGDSCAEFGSAHLFEYDGAAWFEAQVLTPSIQQPLDSYGSFVALAQGVAVVGAHYHDGSGAAFVFRDVDGEFVEEAMLVPSDVGEGDRFGVSVFTDGERVVVGADRHDLNSKEEEGATYVYYWDGNNWEHEQKLTSPVPMQNAAFGVATHLHDERLLVGSFLDETGSQGAVYAFERQAGTWQHAGSLTASDGEWGDWFGWAIDDDGDRIVVGAHAIGYLDGAAYVYDCTPGIDTDGDGLLDSWETDGLDVNADGVIDLDLPAMGADPMFKDLFVEVDVMDGVPLDPDAIADVVDAFAFSPVDNPNGFLGINLHIDLATADTLPFKESWDGDFIDLGDAKIDFFGTDEERNDANWPQIREARAKVFRYCAVVNDADDALGIAETPGNDFMVGFGGVAAGDEHLQASTFMHELGHTLGLDHGGAYYMGDELVQDEINYKPNYVSVMNYGFDQYEYVTGGKLDIDFSREPLLPLIEDNLDETIGISSSAYHDVLVFHAWRQPGELPEIAWVQLDTPSYDWNHDGEQEAGVSVDLNWLGEGYPDGENPSPGQTMNSYNDWDVIMLPMGDTDAFESGQHIPPPYDELTEEGLIFLRENVPPPPTCPPDCNADGELDILDFVCFQGLFQAGDEAADCNADGMLDVLDFVCFQGEFVAGCP